ncbi:MAG TPA: electron transfer flavoprotein subunit alpha/FixB family protein [Streptosporangiaceae bacterium]|nr:electron transfer flavoprotein subunit alpha/FixB family protein [Streptosporangiaceae bacterium]
MSAVLDGAAAAAAGAVTAGVAAGAGTTGDETTGAVLCLAERDGAVVADSSLRALSFAASLAGTAGVTAVLFPGPGAAGPDAAHLDGDLAPDALGAYGVTDVCLVRSDELTGYAPAAWARSLAQLAAAEGMSAVVAAATDRGNEVLAHLGAMTGLPLAANCVAAEHSGPGSWQLVRQRWAGSVLEDAVLAAPCALLTVATDALTLAAPAPSTARPTVGYFTPALTAADLVVLATESAGQSSGMSLATARVVVGGGRGVGGPDGFGALEELAGLLGGVVGVSRVVTSQGWRPHRQQVGQTGTKISPELYLACGISGAIQHMAGCQSARHIVAVNTDADAPIIAHAEYAVIGDVNEVVPALVAAIRARAG